MRILVKVDGKWIEAPAPTDPVALSAMLRRHDGEDAIVADDENGVYYCARPELLASYEQKGKRAKMFHALDFQLFENEMQAASA